MHAQLHQRIGRGMLTLRDTTYPCAPQWERSSGGTRGKADTCKAHRNKPKPELRGRFVAVCRLSQTGDHLLAIPPPRESPHNRPVLYTSFPTQLPAVGTLLFGCVRGMDLGSLLPSGRRITGAHLHQAQSAASCAPPSSPATEGPLMSGHSRSRARSCAECTRRARDPNEAHERHSQNGREYQ
jgi:hypothetical protein